MHAATTLLRPVQHGARAVTVVVRSTMSSLRDEILRHPGGRRRLLIVTATVLVLTYAAGVLTYVVTTPEIGVRTAFTTAVNRFYPEFAYPEGDARLKPGDVIRKVG